MAMKPADECANLEEIRAAIDEIDAQVIALLGERLGYVHAAAKFKTSAATVKAPERVAAMLEQRRAWAVAAGLDPETIAKLYQDLIDYFTQTEFDRFQQR